MIAGLGMACIMLVAGTNVAQAAEVTGQNFMTEKVGSGELKLRYDDHYSVEDLGTDYQIAGIDDQEVTSYQVRNGQKKSEMDENVITQISDTEFVATGTGTAVLAIEDKNNTENVRYINVTVSAAPLTMMYLLGQSNMEGMDANADLTRELAMSVSCEEGTVYASYLPTDVVWANMITGIYFSGTGEASNASDFIAGSLQGKNGISGKTLEYPLNTLTEAGKGKTGPDSAIAYEWNQLTGDKVWVVNTSWSGSDIQSWTPGTFNYKRTAAAMKLAEKTRQAEIDAGHYTASKKLIFWQQGEFETSNTAVQYEADFMAMHDGFNQLVNPDAWGIITVRALDGSGDEASGLFMTGPRASQYGIGGSMDYSDTYVVSNVNEQWTDDASLQKYFTKNYPAGILTYPMHDETYKNAIPTVVSDIHGEQHYTQIGHNENGITAADGMYKVLYKSGIKEVISVATRNQENSDVTAVSLREGDTFTLVIEANPSYRAKNLTYSLSGDSVTLDKLHGTVSAVNAGTGKLRIKDWKGQELKSITFTVKDSCDYREEAGSTYTGIYDDKGTLRYLKNGWMQENYTGLVNDTKGWWYVRDGLVDTSYTGFADNANGWWYVENGRITFGRNDIIEGTVNGIYGWWHIQGSQVMFDCTVTNNANGWWYVENGRVNFNYNGIANNQNGWWRIENGQVNFDYNGLANNQNGWWKIVNGQVDFSYTGITPNENGWWRIEGGKVNFSYNGITNNENGWWKFNGGKVDFGFNGIASNEYGSWYLEGGKVNFGYNGLVWYKDAWRAIYQGRVIV